MFCFGTKPVPAQKLDSDDPSLLQNRKGQMWGQGSQPGARVELRVTKPWKFYPEIGGGAFTTKEVT